MVGITRIGTYFPRRRLDRALIAKAWGTPVPAGTRTVAGLDEDALTMATDAVLACLGDADPAAFDALYFASTSSPYLEKQVASMIATAADLRRDIVVADLAGSVRAGLAALRAALDGCARRASARHSWPRRTRAWGSPSPSWSRSSATGRPRSRWAARAWSRSWSRPRRWPRSSPISGGPTSSARCA